MIYATADYHWYLQNDATILGQVLNVVDLDEEDALPIQPIVQIDGEGW